MHRQYSINRRMCLGTQPQIGIAAPYEESSGVHSTSVDDEEGSLYVDKNFCIRCFLSVSVAKSLSFFKYRESNSMSPYPSWIGNDSSFFFSFPDDDTPLELYLFFPTGFPDGGGGGGNEKKLIMEYQTRRKRHFIWVSIYGGSRFYVHSLHRLPQIYTLRSRGRVLFLDGWEIIIIFIILEGLG